MASNTHARPARPFYTRIALFGIAMYLAVELVILAATLVLLPHSELWYPLLVGSLALASGAVIYLWHPWGLIVGVTVGLVGITFSLDNIGANLSSPDSFFNFAYRPVIWAGGTVLILSGSSAGLVQHLRHRTTHDGPAWVMRAAGGVIALVVAVSLLSATLTVVGIDRISADDRRDAIVITASGWRFSPREVAVASGGPVKLIVENNDAVVHTFTLDALDLDQRLGPFDDTLVVIDIPSSGRYEFRCRITGHENMRGTLVVE